MSFTFYEAIPCRITILLSYSIDHWFNIHCLVQSINWYSFLFSGVAQMVSSPLLEPLVVRGLLLYFSLLKGQTADYYEKGIQTFLEKPVHSPALFFYCLNDPLSDHVVLEEFLQCWEKQGIKVQRKKWTNSVHAGHLRKHTEEYTDTLNSFISSLLNNAPRSRL